MIYWVGRLAVNSYIKKEKKKFFLHSELSKCHFEIDEVDCARNLVLQFTLIEGMSVFTPLMDRE